MSAEIAIWVLLWIGAAAVIVSAIGILAAENVYERLHYLGPAASIGIICITAAIVIREASSQAGIKALLTALVIFVMNPILAHATARAARVHHTGRLAPGEDERIPVLEPGRDRN